MIELKNVIQQLMQEFMREEAGNKVTSNNTMGLLVKLNMAIDGEITVVKPEEKPAKKE